MPLKQLKEEYLEQDGVHFLMEDEAGSTVACRVSHEVSTASTSTSSPASCFAFTSAKVACACPRRSRAEAPASPPLPTAIERRCSQ